MAVRKSNTISNFKKKAFFYFLVIILLSSCSTLDYSNYKSFKKDLSSSKKVSQQVIKTNIEIEKSAFVYESLANEKDLNKIKYPFGGGLENPPFYYSFNKILSKINKIHSGLIFYSDLLLYLASGNDDLIKDVNKVNNSVKEIVDDDAVVDISTIAVYQTINILTKEKRKDLLKQIINNNQEYIEIISNKVIDILETLELSLYSSYDRYFFDLYTNQSVDNNREAIELSIKYNNTLNKIKKIKKFYSNLPKLHKQLLKEEDFDYIGFGIDLSKDYPTFSK